MKNKKIVLKVLIFVWVSLIIFFVVQTADVSNSVSRYLASELSAFFEACGFAKEGLTSSDQLERYNFILRKYAHFLVFLVLSVLCEVTSRKRGFLRGNGIFVLLFCAIVASIGESLQLFVDGRTARIQDVLLDVAGAMTGVLLMLVYRLIKLRFTHKTASKEK